jgi:hypothetical protein
MRCLHLHALRSIREVLDDVCALSHIAVDFLNQMASRTPKISCRRAIRLTLDDRRFFDGATFILPNAQLATSLSFIFSPRAFSCHNVMGERASPGGSNGWDSPSVSHHRVLSVCMAPRTRMMSAPKIDNVCQSLGLATIIANTATTMERPIISPATKLPA